MRMRTVTVMQIYDVLLVRQFAIYCRDYKNVKGHMLVRVILLSNIKISL